MKTPGITLIALAAGLAGGWWLASTQTPQSATTEPQPLYWVAPMDPDYRRDAPGKSPMGMDLIPVYDDAASQSGPGMRTADDAAGTVRISPTVAHNLGVRTAEVVRQRLAVPVETVGVVEFDENLVVHVHPRVEGWVEELTVAAEGDPVATGQVLFRLYSPTLVKAQEEFLLAADRGGTLQQASRQRLKALGMSTTQIDELARRGTAKDRVAITASRSGFVGRLNVREGMYIRPDSEVMTIGGLDTIWVLGEIFERDSAMVRINQRVEIRFDYLPGKVWSGAVDYVYPELDVDTRTVRVRVALENADGQLRPGMFGNLIIHAEQPQEVVAIPREAVILGKPTDRVVLALDDPTSGDQRFRSVPVRRGIEAGNLVEITEGLTAGQRVVVSAQFLIDSESNRQADLGRMESSP